MTPDFINGEITTDGEFDAALGQLLLKATRSDLDLHGSWVYRDVRAISDLEIVIFELASSDDGE